MLGKLNTRKWAKRNLSIFSLTVVYASAIVISRVARHIFFEPISTRRIVVNGTFHNPNWFFSHIEPLVKSGYGEILLVCDASIAHMSRLIYFCPPKWVSDILSRALAKSIWTFMIGRRKKADIFVGYHIFPSATTALICARLTGAKAIYQVTAGQLELEGGGWHAENRLLSGLCKPSLWIERLALAVAREFDLVVVRGSGAKKFLRNAGFKGRIEIITGSIDHCPEAETSKRDIDIVFIGRLTETKRPDRFLAVVERVVRHVPDSRAVIIGDGPEQESLHSMTKSLGIEKNVRFLGKISNVYDWLKKAKVYVLTSRWEGVSIAMLEAMGMGVVPVVMNVGDLKDFVLDGKNGYVCQEGDILSMANRIVELLGDNEKRTKMALAARDAVLKNAEKSGLARKWKNVFEIINSEGRAWF